MTIYNQGLFNPSELTFCEMHTYKMYKITYDHQKKSCIKSRIKSCKSHVYNYVKLLRHGFLHLAFYVVCFPNIANLTKLLVLRIIEVQTML